MFIYRIKYKKLFRVMSLILIHAMLVSNIAWADPPGVLKSSNTLARWLGLHSPNITNMIKAGMLKEQGRLLVAQPQTLYQRLLENNEATAFKSKFGSIIVSNKIREQHHSDIVSFFEKNSDQKFYTQKQAILNFDDDPEEKAIQTIIDKGQLTLESEDGEQFLFKLNNQILLDGREDMIIEIYSVEHKELIGYLHASIHIDQKLGKNIVLHYSLMKNDLVNSEDAFLREALYIKKDYRRRGIAQTAMAIMLRLAKRQNITKAIIIEALSSEFYEKIGFKEVKVPEIVGVDPKRFYEYDLSLTRDSIKFPKIKIKGVLKKIGTPVEKGKISWKTQEDLNENAEKIYSWFKNHYQTSEKLSFTQVLVSDILGSHEKTLYLYWCELVNAIHFLAEVELFDLDFVAKDEVFDFIINSFFKNKYKAWYIARYIHKTQKPFDEISKKQIADDLGLSMQIVVKYFPKAIGICRNQKSEQAKELKVWQERKEFLEQKRQSTQAHPEVSFIGQSERVREKNSKIKRKKLNEYLKLLVNPPLIIEDPSNSVCWKNSNYGKLVQYLIKHFGSWHAALKEVGLEPIEQGKPIWKGIYTDWHEVENVLDKNETNILLQGGGVIRKPRLLTPNEEISLSELIKKGNIAARETLVQTNLRIVHQLARRAISQNDDLTIDYDRIFNVGKVGDNTHRIGGLTRAAELFDPKKERNKFVTYAWKTVLGTLKNYIAKKRKVMMLSLDAPVRKDARTSFVEYVEDYREPSEDNSNEPLVIEMILPYLDQVDVSDRNKEMFKCRYIKGMSLVDIGVQFNISRSRVGQVTLVTLNKLIALVKVVSDDNPGAIKRMGDSGGALEKTLFNAQRSLDQGDFDNAIVFADKVIEAFNNFETLKDEDLGKFLKELDPELQANSDFNPQYLRQAKDIREKALKKVEEYALVKQASKNLKAKLYYSAIENCNKALALNPSNKFAYKLLAQAYLKMKEFSKAITVLSDDKGNDLKSVLNNDPISYNILANILFESGNINLAIKLLTDSTGSNLKECLSSNDSSYTALAKLFNSSGQYEEAIAVLSDDNAIKLKTVIENNSFCYTEIVESLRNLNRAEDAIKILCKDNDVYLKDSLSTNIYIYNLLSELLISEKKYKELHRIIDAMFNKFSNNPKAYIFAADLLMKIDKTKRAKTLIANGARKFPENDKLRELNENGNKPIDSTLSLRAQEHFKKGEYEETIKLTQKAIEENPNNKYAYALLAKAFYTLGNLESALVTLSDNDGLSLKTPLKNNRVSFNLLLKILEELDRFDDVIKLFCMPGTKILKKYHAQDKVTSINFSKFLERLGSVDDAISVLSDNGGRNLRDIFLKDNVPYFILIQLLAKKSDNQKQKELLNELIEKFAKTVDAYIFAINQYIGMGMDEKAKGVLLIALKQFPENSSLEHIRANRVSGIEINLPRKDEAPVRRTNNELKDFARAIEKLIINGDLNEAEKQLEDKYEQITRITDKQKPTSYKEHKIVLDLFIRLVHGFLSKKSFEKANFMLIKTFWKYHNLDNLFPELKYRDIQLMKIYLRATNLHLERKYVFGIEDNLRNFLQIQKEFPEDINVLTILLILYTALDDITQMQEFIALIETNLPMLRLNGSMSQVVSSIVIKAKKRLKDLMVHRTIKIKDPKDQPVDESSFVVSSSPAEKLKEARENLSKALKNSKENPDITELAETTKILRDLINNFKHSRKKSIKKAVSSAQSVLTNAENVIKKKNAIGKPSLKDKRFGNSGGALEKLLLNTQNAFDSIYYEKAISLATEIIELFKQFNSLEGKDFEVFLEELDPQSEANSDFLTEYLDKAQEIKEHASLYLLMKQAQISTSVELVPIIKQDPLKINPRFSTQNNATKVSSHFDTWQYGASASDKLWELIPLKDKEKNEKGRILLYGPGNSVEDLFLVFRRFPELEEVYVVDADLSNLEFIQKKLKTWLLGKHHKIKLVHSDFSNMPFPKGYFDLAYSKFVFDRSLLIDDVISEWVLEWQRVSKENAVFFGIGSYSGYFDQNTFKLIAQEDLSLEGNYADNFLAFKKKAEPVINNPEKIINKSVKKKFSWTKDEDFDNYVRIVRSWFENNLEQSNKIHFSILFISRILGCSGNRLREKWDKFVQALMRVTRAPIFDLEHTPKDTIDVAMIEAFLKFKHKEWYIARYLYQNNFDLNTLDKRYITKIFRLKSGDSKIEKAIEILRDPLKSKKKTLLELKELSNREKFSNCNIVSNPMIRFKGKSSNPSKKKVSKPKKLEEYLRLLKKPPKKIVKPSSSTCWKNNGYPTMVSQLSKYYKGWHNVLKEVGRKPIDRGNPVWIGKYTDWDEVREILDKNLLTIIKPFGEIVSYNRLLTSDEEKALSKLIKKGNFAARETLVEANIGLIIDSAKLVYGLNQDLGLDFPELVQIGKVGTVTTKRMGGLTRAAELYDGDKGFKFSTYAQNSVKKLLYGYVKRLRKIRAISLDAPLNKRTETSRITLIEQTIKPPQQESEVKAEYELILKNLDLVDTSKRNKKIFMARMSDQKTLEDVGIEYGITKERVRQIVGKVFVKLKKVAEEQQLHNKEKDSTKKNRFGDSKGKLNKHLSDANRALEAGQFEIALTLANKVIKLFEDIEPLEGDQLSEFLDDLDPKPEVNSDFDPVFQTQAYDIKIKAERELAKIPKNLLSISNIGPYFYIGHKGEFVIEDNVNGEISFRIETKNKIDPKNIQVGVLYHLKGSYRPSVFEEAKYIISETPFKHRYKVKLEELAYKCQFKVSFNKGVSWEKLDTEITIKPMNYKDDLPIKIGILSPPLELLADNSFVQPLIGDRKVHFVLNDQLSRPSELIRVIAHCGDPSTDTPWTDVEATYIRKDSFNDFRFQVVLPKGTKVYTLRVSYDGGRVWQWLEQDIKVQYSKSKVSNEDIPIKTKKSLLVGKTKDVIKVSFRPTMLSDFDEISKIYEKVSGKKFDRKKFENYKKEDEVILQSVVGSSGYLVGYFVYKSNESRFHFKEIGVDPDYYNRGIEKQIIDMIKKYLSLDRIQKVSIVIRESDSYLRKILESEGFVGLLRKDRFKDPSEDGYLMTYHLIREIVSDDCFNEELAGNYGVLVEDFNIHGLPFSVFGRCINELQNIFKKVDKSFSIKYISNLNNDKGKENSVNPFDIGKIVTLFQQGDKLNIRIESNQISQELLKDIAAHIVEVIAAYKEDNYRTWLAPSRIKITRIREEFDHKLCSMLGVGVSDETLDDKFATLIQNDDSKYELITDTNYHKYGDGAYTGAFFLFGNDQPNNHIISFWKKDWEFHNSEPQKHFSYEEWEVEDFENREKERISAEKSGEFDSEEFKRNKQLYILHYSQDSVTNSIVVNPRRNSVFRWKPDEHEKLIEIGYKDKYPYKGEPYRAFVSKMMKQAEIQQKKIDEFLLYLEQHHGGVPTYLKRFTEWSDWTHDNCYITNGWVVLGIEISPDKIESVMTLLKEYEKYKLKNRASKSNQTIAETGVSKNQKLMMNILEKPSTGENIDLRALNSASQSLQHSRDHVWDDVDVQKQIRNENLQWILNNAKSKETVVVLGAGTVDYSILAKNKDVKKVLLIDTNPNYLKAARAFFPESFQPNLYTIHANLDGLTNQFYKQIGIILSEKNISFDQKKQNLIKHFDNMLIYDEIMRKSFLPENFADIVIADKVYNHFSIEIFQIINSEIQRLVDTFKFQASENELKELSQINDELVRILGQMQIEEWDRIAKNDSLIYVSYNHLLTNDLDNTVDQQLLDNDPILVGNTCPWLKRQAGLPNVQWESDFFDWNYKNEMVKAGEFTIKAMCLKLQSDEESVIQAFDVLDDIIDDKSQLIGPLSDLKGNAQDNLNPDVRKLRLCVPFDIVKNCADIIRTFKQGLSDKVRGIIPIELVVTGVDKGNIDLILSLNNYKHALNLPENFTVSVLEEADILQRAKDTGVESSDPIIRTEIIANLTTEKNVLIDGEQMAIATTDVLKSQSSDLEEQLAPVFKKLNSQYDNCISIGVLAKEDDQQCIFSLSQILSSWLGVDAQATLGVIDLKPVISLEIFQKLEHALMAAWKQMISV